MDKLGFKEQQSYSTGGTAKSLFQYKLELKSQESFFEDLEIAIEQTSKRIGLGTEGVMDIVSKIPVDEITKKNIWVLSIALLMIAHYSTTNNALKSVKGLKIDEETKIDVIRYIRAIKNE